MHDGLPPADQLPWTISYVIRKRMQIDSYAELPKEKRPPEWMIWYATSEEIDGWFDKVFDRKNRDNQNPNEIILNIADEDIG